MEDTLAARLGAQLLTRRSARRAEDVVGHLLAVQAQDPRGARLAVRARSSVASASDVDRALSVDRSLVVGWLNRGTLHLVRTEDYWWLHALTTPRLLTGTMRRLSEEGVDVDDAERGLVAVTTALGSSGPLTRADLRERVESAGVRAAGQALVHLLALATVRGLVVRGPVVGAEQAFVLAEDWVGRRPPPVDRGSCLGELARRYLTGHGPATDADLARWAGVPLRDARAGLSEVADLLVERPDGSVELRAAARGHATDEPPPRLLGAFDPVLHGWRSRADVLGAHDADVVSGGVFRAFALVGGRAAGLWRLAGDRVVVSPFAALDDVVAAALERDGHDVVAFLTRSPRGARASHPDESDARLVHQEVSPRTGPPGPGRPEEGR